MTDADILRVVQEELGNIAPEINLSAVSSSSDLRDALDIDSMDFLNFITAIHRRLGVDIPELEYPNLFTLDGAVKYLKKKLSVNMR